MKRLVNPIRAEIEGLLLRGAFSGNERLLGMCNELYDHRQWLWTFLDHEGVELTNNGSERALRHAVIWRKLSFGTQSARGSRFVETMLTVIETCRQQGQQHLHVRGRCRPCSVRRSSRRSVTRQGVNGYGRIRSWPNRFTWGSSLSIKA